MQDPMVNPFLLTETFLLLEAVQKIEVPLNFLTDRFFKPTRMLTQDYIAVEYRSEHRILAPALSENNFRGVDINRGTSKVKFYRPMRFGARRTISLFDLKTRFFGEVPNLYNPVSIQERQSRLQAEDLAELMKLFANRREQMVSELLQTGKIKINAYSEDGIVTEQDEVDYEFDGILRPTVPWSNPQADIYGDIKAASERIQRRCGVIPTVAICGKNVEKYLLQNEALLKWLYVPSRENMVFSSWAPHWTSPEVRYIGRVQALNCEFVTYPRTYMDDATNTVKPYIDDDTLLLACENLGETVFVPITVFDEGSGFRSIAAPLVPRYSSNAESQTLALSLFSNFLVIPKLVSTWSCIKTLG